MVPIEQKIGLLNNCMSELESALNSLVGSSFQQKFTQAGQKLGDYFTVTGVIFSDCNEKPQIVHCCEDNHTDYSITTKTTSVKEKMFVAISQDTPENYQNIKAVLDLIQVQEKCQTDHTAHPIVVISMGMTT